MRNIIAFILIGLFLSFACSQKVEKTDSEKRMELARDLEKDIDKIMSCRIHLSGTTNTEMTIYLNEANRSFVNRFCQQDKTLKTMREQGFGEVYIVNGKGEKWSILPECGKNLKW